MQFGKMLRAQVHAPVPGALGELLRRQETFWVNASGRPSNWRDSTGCTSAGPHGMGSDIRHVHRTALDKIRSHFAPKIGHESWEQMQQVIQQVTDLRLSGEDFTFGIDLGKRGLV